MLLIKDIIWISEKIGEADVVVTDGNYEIRCFPFYTHPTLKTIPK
ncbi:hypothetical protein BN1356_01098 [Streptococcus varani]|uniref:Uncharacterized protein n=1 Tax=Streptococcus varani TaxID=1608583 RepID=A0A0E4CSN0_9STRE|nr:hypothetical protein [Streptococcus varani]CQR24742.1 hypothetical protein BN1356_01098 [Streptococcus varani]